MGRLSLRSILAVAFAAAALAPARPSSAGPLPSQAAKTVIEIDGVSLPKTCTWHVEQPVQPPRTLKPPHPVESAPLAARLGCPAGDSTLKAWGGHHSKKNLWIVHVDAAGKQIDRKAYTCTPVNVGGRWNGSELHLSCSEHHAKH